MTFEERKVAMKDLKKQIKPFREEIIRRISTPKGSSDERDAKIQHINFIIDNFAYFDSYKYDKDILKNEIADINNDPEIFKQYEDTCGIDMTVITEIADIFTEYNFNTDILRITIDD